MKNVNLDELEKMIGKENVEKCFTEYMMLMIASKSKLDSFLERLSEIQDSETLTVNEINDMLS